MLNELLEMFGLSESELTESELKELKEYIEEMESKTKSLERYLFRTESDDNIVFKSLEKLSSLIEE